MMAVTVAQQEGRASLRCGHEDTPASCVLCPVSCVLRKPPRPGEFPGQGSQLGTAQPRNPPAVSHENPQPSRQRGLYGKLTFWLHLREQSGQTYRGQTHSVIANLSFRVFLITSGGAAGGNLCLHGKLGVV